MLRTTSLLLLATGQFLFLSTANPLAADEPDIEIVKRDLTMTVDLGGSELFKAKKDVFRVSVTRSDIVTFNQYSPREFEVIGRRLGDSTMTIWFGRPGRKDVETLRYLVKVKRKQKRNE